LRQSLLDLFGFHILSTLLSMAARTWRRGPGARAKVQVLYLAEPLFAEFTRAVLASEDLDKENRGDDAAPPALGDFVRRCLASVGTHDYAHGDVVFIGKQAPDATDTPDAPSCGTELAVDMVVCDDSNTWDAAVSLLGSVHTDPEFEDTRAIPTSVTDGLCDPLLFYSALHGPPYNFKDHLYVEVSARHPAALTALASGVKRFEAPSAAPKAEFFAFALQAVEAGAWAGEVLR
jgi:hypothetical protein